VGDIMSTLKLNGASSGSSIIKAPDSGSTGQTFTLPASTGTLAKTSDIPAAVGGATGADFNDNVKIRLGTGNDLEIYHDASNSYIKDAGTGSLKLLASKHYISNADASKDHIIMTDGGAVDIYHNNSRKLITTADGIEINGEIEIGSAFAFTGEGGSNRLTIAHNTGNVWIDGNCSAASFTDRTPYPETVQLAYDVINSHKKLPDGQYKADDHSKQLDHSQLHDYVKAEDNNRNMSGVISCLVEVIKDLEARIKVLEA